jgi:ankyrin repeat protein
MNVVFPERSPMDFVEKSPSVRSSLSSRTFHKYSTVASSPASSAATRFKRLHAGASFESSIDLTDDDTDFDDRSSVREHLRFAPHLIRRRASRRNSSTRTARVSEASMIQAPRTTSIHVQRHSTSNKDINAGYVSMSNDPLQRALAREEIYGETLLHLTSRLGHDEIMRLLINETSQASTLINRQGQTPLLLAIESNSTSTAMLLMESNPRSIVMSDFNQSNVFHYACDHANDVVLHRALLLSKRLQSSSDRITVNDHHRIDPSGQHSCRSYRLCVESSNEIMPVKVHSTLPFAKVS